MRLSIVVAVAVGCAPSDPVDLRWVPAAPDLDGVEGGAEPAGALRSAVTLTIDPIVPGDQTRFVVTGAGANELVHLARSTNGLGAGPCLGTLGGLCLDVNGPVTLHGSATADATGVAVLVQTVPESVPIGVDAAFQAVIPRGATGLSWVKSQPVEVTTLDAPLVASAMVAGDLRITELMIDPTAVADSAGEWFEIQNTSGLDANLDGLVLTDGITVFPLAETRFIGAGETKVFGIDADPATNGGVDVDWAYTGIDLADAFGEIYLMRGATIIDGVAWDDGQSFPVAPGVTMALDPDADHLDNDVGQNWCLGRAGGSPGRTNPACTTESVGIFDISPADRAVLISGGGGNWLNVANVALTIDQALTGPPRAEHGWANHLQGTVVEYTFDSGLVNGPGADLVVFDARFDAGEYQVSTDHDGFVAGTPTSTAGWVATGVTPSFFFGGILQGPASIDASEIDLSDLGIPEGVSVTRVRTFATNSATDPVGIGAL
ncbi:MAG: lamin tail domain-containing protein [Myxococcota bacterium]